MDLTQALKHLEIDINDINVSNTLTPEYIKRRYHKMALLHHPDKNGDTKKFQLINEAFTFLMEEIRNDNLDLNLDSEPNYSSNYSSNTFYNSFSPYPNFESEFKQENIYVNLLYSFIEGILGTDEPNSPFIKVIKNVIKEIVFTTKTEVSLLSIFENIEKDTSLEIYNFIFKYKRVLHLDPDLVLKIEVIVKSKYANDLIFSLNPTLKDILDNNIYKLYVDGELYLVPLWHNELYFLKQSKVENGHEERKEESNLEKEIIVLCNPVLPPNVSIDDDNNILLEHILQIDEIKTLLKGNVCNRPCLDIQLGNKVLKIPLQNLNIKKEQIYIIKREGIAQIMDDDMYNISCKSDVIVKVILAG
jgi:hypothetical protein